MAKSFVVCENSWILGTLNNSAKFSLKAEMNADVLGREPGGPSSIQAQTDNLFYQK